MTDEAGKLFRLARDNESVPSSAASAGGRLVALVSNKLGNITQVTDPGGTDVRITRDAMERIVRISDRLDPSGLNPRDLGELEALVRRHAGKELAEVIDRNSLPIGDPPPANNHGSRESLQKPPWMGPSTGTTGDNVVRPGQVFELRPRRPLASCFCGFCSLEADHSHSVAYTILIAFGLGALGGLLLLKRARVKRRPGSDDGAGY